MKKIILALAAVLVLSSCSASVPATKGVPDTAFTANVEMTFGRDELSGEIFRFCSGQWRLTVTEPYALEGLTMTLSDGKCRCELLGMESMSDVGSDAVSAVKAIAAAYDTAVTTGAAVSSADGGYVVSGTSELGEYTVTLDAQGVPLGFTADGLSVSIKSFEPTDVPEFEAELIE